MNSRRFLSRLLTTATALALATLSPGYVFILDDSGCVSTWHEGTIPMLVKLNNSQILTDGTTQVQSVLAAMQEWNAHLGTVQFVGTAAAPGTYGIWDGTSEIAIDNAIHSDGESFPFDEHVLAVTISFDEGNFTLESDIIFNSAYQWDSFRGGQWTSAHDIRRVAAHELGHVLGLGHPDEGEPPQYGSFLMNSIVSYGPPIESPQPDDINGAQVLYGFPGFVSVNDNFSEALAITMPGTVAFARGTNVAASKESGEPNHAADEPGGRSVWWKWTSSGFGTLTVTTAGSNFDTMLGAYTGAAVDALTQLAANDDVEKGVIRTSTLSIPVEVGTTYYFAVDGWDGVVGAIRLNLSLAQDPSKPPPVFTTRPYSRNSLTGQPVTFVAQTDSPFPVTYSWRHNGNVLAGQNGSELHLPVSSIEASGLYEVIASNANGSASSILHLRVLPSNLSVVGWGQNDYGDLAPPAGTGNVFTASAGTIHNLAVRTDGTVVGWGSNLGNRSTPPDGLTGVVSVAAGWNHSLALRTDGTVVGWGEPDSFNLTHGPATEAPAGLADVIAISAGSSTSLALRADGTVLWWGRLLGTPTPADLAGVVAIASGPDHSLALKSDGTVVAWGYGGYGEVQVPDGLSDVVAIDAGNGGAGSHNLALKADGTVVAWGDNMWGQCNVPAGLTGVVAIGAGSRHSLALKSDGVLVGWGEGIYGQLDFPTDIARIFEVSGGARHSVAVVQKLAPVILSQPVGLTATNGDAVSFAVVASGTALLSYQWKQNGVPIVDGNGITGATSANLRIEQIGVSDAGDYTVSISNDAGTVTSTTATLIVATPPTLTLRPRSTTLSAGAPATFTVQAEGSGQFTYEWRHNRSVIPGASGASLELASVTLSDAGYYEAIVRNAEGGASSSLFYVSVAVETPTILTWGDYANVPPPIDQPVAAIAVGVSSLALGGNGEVLAWGPPGFGQASVPAGLGGVVAIAAARSHSLALTSNGTVVGWGSDQLGSATPPPGLTGVVAIAAGKSHSIALKSDGTVVTWGDPAVPTPARLRNVVAVAAPNDGFFALKSDGTVVGWGGLQSDSQPPAGLSDVISISSNEFLHFAVKRNGMVVAWGFDTFGSTVVPQNLQGVTSIASGSSHGLAALSDGSVVAWGRGHENQTKVPAGLDNAVAVAAREGSSMALLRTLPPVILAQPVNREAVVGDYVTFSVAVDGTIPFAYQWSRDGVPLADGNGVSGAMSATLVLDPVKAGSAGSYDVAVMNKSGDVLSSAASLTVRVPPMFVSRPLSRIVKVGTAVTFDGTATDSSAVTYQWKHNGVLISGANGPTLTLTAVRYTDRGFYEVVASNADASNWSTFTLNVSPIDTADLAVAAWGDGSYPPNGPAGIAPDLGSVVALATKFAHALALNADGKVTGWGMDFSGTVTPPAGLSEVVGIAAGHDHSLALRANGTVVSWGRGSYYSSPVPAGLRNVVSIAAGDRGSLALKADGTVVAWGVNQPPAGLSNVVAVAFGADSCLALKSDGSVVAWEDAANSFYPPPGGLGGVVAIAGENHHAIALKADGTVTSWGNGFNPAQFVPGGVDRVIGVAAGDGHSAVLRDDGSLQAWGDNLAHQIEPRPDLMPAAMLVAGGGLSLVLTPNLIAPAFTIHPEDKLSLPGGYILLAVKATGRPTPSLQWQKDGVDLSGANGEYLNISDAEFSDSGKYRVIAANTLGSITSNEVSVLVTVRAEAPVLSPAGGTLVSGESIVITSATEGATIRYTTDSTIPSYLNGYDYTGPIDIFTSPTTIRAIARKEGFFDSNSVWETYNVIPNSSPMIGTARIPRMIAGQAISTTLAAQGGNGPLVWTIASGSLPSGLSLSAAGALSGTPTATGTSAVTVRVVDSDGVTGPSDEDTLQLAITVDATDSVPAITTVSLPDAGLSLAYSANLAGSGGNGQLTWSLASGSLPPGLTLSEGGLISGIPHSLGNRTFTVRVADDDTITGAADEATKELSITVVPAPRLTNVSMRAFAGAGDDTLVVGFHIAGTGQKTVLIRGIGPKLLDHNVPSVVADPSITLYREKTPLLTNNDWDAALVPVFLDAGAFPLDVGSKDAAMTATLAPGGYTIHLVNTSLVAEALIEVYDISRDAGTRLVNVSSRLRFQPGQLAILGTAVTGGPISVLARNVGPGIADFLVNPLDALPDPKLALFSGQTMMSENQDWDVALLPFFGSAGAFTIDEGSKDAAIRAQFQIGAYTVHSTGNGGEGVAIIEIYESP